jgi:hypothetical protein
MDPALNGGDTYDDMFVDAHAATRWSRTTTPIASSPARAPAFQQPQRVQPDDLERL